MGRADRHDRRDLRRVLHAADGAAHLVQRAGPAREPAAAGSVATRARRPGAARGGHDLDGRIPAPVPRACRSHAAGVDLNGRAPQLADHVPDRCPAAAEPASPGSPRCRAGCARGATPAGARGAAGGFGGRHRRSGCSAEWEVMDIDLSNPAHYGLALLPEIVLSVWAMFLLLLDVFQKGARSRPSSSALPWLTLIGILLAAGANVLLMTFEETGTGGMIAIDGFRVFVNFVFLLAAALFVLISTRYLDEANLRLGELYVLVLFATVGMMSFAGARDLMVMFIALELMSLPVYVLTGLNRRDARSAEGALKYFLLGAFSSAFFLFGIALTYGGAGSTNLEQIGAAVGVDGLAASSLLVVATALLAVGFGFKVAAVPFHMWTPDAYEGAPSPVTAFMAAGIKAAAFAGFLRVFQTAFQGLYDTWDAIAVWLAVLTMVTANLIALVQGNVKRMLAYSSIAHAGYLLVALAAASELGAASLLFYVTTYTLMTMGAFAVVMVVARHGEERLDLDAYIGLGWRRPLLATTMTIFLLSLAGFPFTGGFIGKVFILRAAVEKGLVLLAVVLVLASLVSYFYYLRVAWYMWFRDPVETDDATEPVALAPAMTIALVIAAVGTIVLGVLPHYVLAWAEDSAAGLLQLPAGLVGAGR